MVLVINGVVMVVSGLSMASVAGHDQTWNGRLCVAVSWLWAGCGVFVIICGIVQVVRAVI